MSPPTTCFHCGEAVPRDYTLTALIDGIEQPMCCPGCRAVAGMIAASGLESFYTLRTDFAPRPEVDTPISDAYTLFDEPENHSGFVSMVSPDIHEARLLIAGISCAACTWLIENSLRNLPGVVSAELNLAQHSLRVQWQESELKLSRIFHSIATLGYQPYPWKLSLGAELIATEQRQSLRQLAVAGLGMMQVGMFAIALHAGEIQGIADEYRSLLRWVSLIVSSVVVVYSARSFFRNAWINLRQKHLVMDTPVALAIGLAWTASAYATFTNSGQVYFDSVSMFTFFLLLGRFVERRTRQQELLRQIDLQSLLPTTARKAVDGDWQQVPCHALNTGDTLLLNAGTQVPADGRLLVGTASVDEAALTGEHQPRAVCPGDTVSAGTVLLEGNPQLEVLAAGDATRIAQTLALSDVAQQHKPPIALLADHIASYFVAAILFIAGAVAWYWWQQDPQRALWVTLSVLVVSCPCALALATPAALARASTALKRRGLLLCKESVLEKLRGIDTVLFDKTGTLTRGDLTLASTHTFANTDEQLCQQLAAALEQYSNHPAARAFGDSGSVQLVQPVNTPGRGVSASWQGQHYRIGSAEYARELNPGLLQHPATEGYWIVLCSATATLAWFRLRDQVRPEAASIVAELKRLGLRVELLTGDSSSAGSELAAKLSMDDCHSGQSAAQKLEYLRQKQAAGHRVLMVGDGLNDAPVLAAADVSIAVSGATDLAKARADAIVINNRLQPLLDGFIYSKRCFHIIYQNIAWALAYNASLIPLAAAGMVPPWAAAIGMSLSSLLVVTNSLRLK
ncbi:cadmium-translocating P-type ATPase [Halieaceae bacterium IMCC14734]|uniref:Cadmium-translocating P-type ATPase n=1 Tax=Candidatus Litorirhabdus singularis TaxID=2518993 RepID=A0ABT3THX4_9GAMM|nr:heavy metal translocating P-type ATPase [Candidatus Litorirhabdus singularis]MCX2981876.1 cadmium-translocating P-type ATPase [Candidatus Litorirhabdus singularis]